MGPKAKAASTKDAPAKKRTRGKADAAPAKSKLDTFGVDALCDRIVGGTSMTAVAGEVGVSIGTLISWVEADVERSARTREARRQSARIWDEQAMHGIALASNQLELAKAREVAQHLRWRASKIAPREYGEKLALGGADDLPPIQQTMNLKALSAEELATLEALARKAAAVSA